MKISIVRMAMMLLMTMEILIMMMMLLMMTQRCIWDTNQAAPEVL